MLNNIINSKTYNNNFNKINNNNKEVGNNKKILIIRILDQQ